MKKKYFILIMLLGLFVLVWWHLNSSSFKEDFSNKKIPQEMNISKVNFLLYYDVKGKIVYKLNEVKFVNFDELKKYLQQLTRNNKLFILNYFDKTKKEYYSSFIKKLKKRTVVAEIDKKDNKIKFNEITMMFIIRGYTFSYYINSPRFQFKTNNFTEISPSSDHEKKKNLFVVILEDFNVTSSGLENIFYGNYAEFLSAWDYKYFVQLAEERNFGKIYLGKKYTNFK